VTASKYPDAGGGGSSFATTVSMHPYLCVCGSPHFALPFPCLNINCCHHYHQSLIVSLSLAVPACLHRPCCHPPSSLPPNPSQPPASMTDSPPHITGPVHHANPCLPVCLYVCACWCGLSTKPLLLSSLACYLSPAPIIQPLLYFLPSQQTDDRFSYIFSSLLDNQTLASPLHGCLTLPLHVP